MLEEGWKLERKINNRHNNGEGANQQALENGGSQNPGAWQQNGETAELLVPESAPTKRVRALRESRPQKTIVAATVWRQPMKKCA